MVARAGDVPTHRRNDSVFVRPDICSLERFVFRFGTGRDGTGTLRSLVSVADRAPALYRSPVAAGRVMNCGNDTLQCLPFFFAWNQLQ